MLRYFQKIAAAFAASLMAASLGLAQNAASPVMVTPQATAGSSGSGSSGSVGGSTGSAGAAVSPVMIAPSIGAADAAVGSAAEPGQLGEPTLPVVVTPLIPTGPLTAATSAEIASGIAEADRFFAQKSYNLALEKYKALAGLQLPAPERAYVEFRVADATWRNLAGTNQSDPAVFMTARAMLQKLANDVAQASIPGRPPRLWAEIEESLADSWWGNPQMQDWGQAWQNYDRALKWWANSTDLALARTRYLAIVFKCVQPGPFVWQPWGPAYGMYVHQVPLEVLINAAKIAQTPADVAQTQYFLAQAFTNSGDPAQILQVTKAFEAALTAGRETPWYDDALFGEAQWLENSGNITFDDRGRMQRKPDYTKALELYQRLLAEIPAGDSRFRNPAEEAVRRITNPTIDVQVTGVYLPGSLNEIYVDWRNVEAPKINVYPVDLAKDVKFPGFRDVPDTSRPPRGRGPIPLAAQPTRRVETEPTEWWYAADLAGKTATKTLTTTALPDSQYAAVNEKLWIEPGLPPGAYVLEAVAGDKRARMGLIVTDQTVVVQFAPGKAVAYLANAQTGQPVPDAAFTLWTGIPTPRGSNVNVLVPRTWERREVKAAKDGLLQFDLPRINENVEVFLTAAAPAADKNPARPAYAAFNDWAGRQNNGREWRMYVFTDRPAFRPGETASWKLIARQRDAQDVYTVPANTAVTYEINGPRGDRLATGQVTLDAFGAAWGEVKLPAEAPLGIYYINFRLNNNLGLGGSQLLRLEEYKLPEYKVAVSTGKGADGKAPAYRMGQKVPIEVKAEYYFGGPVADSDVELVVMQRPYQPVWNPRPVPYPWLRDESSRPWFQRGPGQTIVRQQLKTDAEGVARFQIDTPGFSESDLEYTVVANVTDASRRQINGQANVRVTRQSFFAFLDPRNRLVRPGGDLDVRLKTQNANEQPVAVAGKVTIVRREYLEIFVNPDGREFTAAQVRTARASAGGLLGLFSSDPRFTFKERRMNAEVVFTQDLTTDKDGQGTVRFTAAKPGLYEVTFASPDVPAPPVKAVASVYVGDQNTSELNAGGSLRLIVNQDTVKVGESADVVVILPSSGGYVLLTTQAETLIDARLLPLNGDAKFLQLPVTDAWVPNVRVVAATVHNLALNQVYEEVQAPPVKNFLDVAAEFSQPKYLPRGQGAVKITVKDDKGNPVPDTQLALSVVDDSVFYIQPELAGDPRQFFYGDRRQFQGQLLSSFNFGQYRKITTREQPKPVDNYRDEDGDLAYAETASVSRQNYSTSKSGMAMDSVAQRASGGMASMAATAMPMAPEAPAPAMEMAKDASGNGAGGADFNPTVVVRSDFRSSILWLPAMKTGADGTASTTVTFPDNTTAWRVTARADSLPAKFGWGNSTAQTQLPLIARLQAPRFFVTGDRLLISGVFNNNTDQALTVRPTLTATGLNLLNVVATGAAPNFVQPGAANPTAGTPGPVTAQPNHEVRVDWLVGVANPGTANITLKGVSGNFGDAMEKNYPVFEHGINKFTAISGKIPQGSGEIHVDLPPRKATGQQFTVRVSSSLAVSLLDALPYLVSYPYGCTEQTMSRFVPAVVVSKTLRDLGASPADIAGRVFGGIEPQFATKTQPGDVAPLAQLDAVTAQGLARLYDFQHSSGAWGWWKDDGDDLYMTAYVLWGLTLAQQAGVTVTPEVLARARAYLDTHLVDAEIQPDMQAWLLNALSSRFATTAAADVRPSRAEARAFTNLMAQRDRLNAFTRALLTISARRLGFVDDARLLAQNLRNGVKMDRDPRASVLISEANNPPQPFAAATAHWGEDGIYYRWADGGVEATAFGLMALLTADPTSDLVGPVSQWLVQNRRGAQWSNTRDSAICVLALTQYLKDSGELTEGLQAEVLVNGTSVGKLDVAAGAAAAVRAPGSFTVDPAVLKDGANVVTLKRLGGAAPLYFSARANYFSLENPIAPAGHELFVRRQYFRVKPAATLLEGFREQLEPLADGATLNVGDQVEVALFIEGKNNLEYLMFEDLKPAGLEAAAVRSGAALTAREVRAGKLEALLAGRTLANPAPGSGDGPIIPLDLKIAGPGILPPVPGSDADSPYTGRERGVYQELRDRQVTSFLSRLPEGLWEIRYRLRAEIPGYFHALPVLGEAMYVPEIRANSAEIRVTVQDAPTP